MERILVISEIGCGPPFLGNRARMRSLLSEIRRLGLEIHFADVNMADAEKESTRPFVDQWVTSFLPSSRQTHRNSLPQRAIQWIQRRLRPSAVMEHPAGCFDLDAWFSPHWAPQAQALQKQQQYQRVLVPYVFHSAFLNAFGDDCLKMLDTHDQFAGRRERLLAQGIAGTWFTTNTEGEREGVMRADVILAIQSLEAQYFSALTNGQREVRTIGHLLEVPENNGRQPIPVGLSSQIGFLASDNPLNLHGWNWFIQSVWPRIVAEVPNCRVAVGGRICRRISADPGVLVLGELDDVNDLYSQCLFTINPMQEGTGLKIKCIESLAHSRTVVATSVAAAGIEAPLRTAMVVADTPETFAAAVVKLLTSPDTAAALGKQGAEMIQELNGQISRELSRALRIS